MNAFLREVVIAMREGPYLFFIPIMAAVKTAKQSSQPSQPARSNPHQRKKRV